MIQSSSIFNVTSLSLPSRLVYGAGCATGAAVQFVRGRYKRVALLATRSAQLATLKIAAALVSEGVEVETFQKPSSEPTLRSCKAAIAEVRSFAPDAVLALGGGSVLDVAKLVAALHDRSEPLESFIGSGLVPPRRTGLACVPTTAGTGSEVSPNSILLDEALGEKKAVISPALVPDAAIVDPELLVSLPPALTATTGVDALSHCLEAYASLAAHPLVDPYALEGVRLIGAHLPRAVARGDDLEARAALALGSLYGGLGLGPVNTNGVHALAYPLGGIHLPHGLAISLMLPHVVAFNSAVLQQRHAALGRALGSTEADDSRAAAELPLRLRALLEACHVPLGLSKHGVARSDLPRLADAGLRVTRLLKANPRTVARADALRIYEAAY